MGQQGRGRMSESMAVMADHSGHGAAAAHHLALALSSAEYPVRHCILVGLGKHWTISREPALFEFFPARCGMIDWHDDLRRKACRTGYASQNQELRFEK